MRAGIYYIMRAGGHYFSLIIITIIFVVNGTRDKTFDLMTSVNK